jgi:carbonic anhydrase
MLNKLFIVCPFSRMETFLQSKYGDDIFFLTCTATVLPYKDFEYILEIKQFIIRERIKKIYIVNDTACPFINGIIKQNKNIGFPAEKVLEELYIEYYFTDFKHQSLFHQQYKLAELNVKNQVDELLYSTLLGDSISQLNLEIKGLITTKEKELFQKNQINNNHTIYEY